METNPPFATPPTPRWDYQKKKKIPGGLYMLNIPDKKCGR